MANDFKAQYMETILDWMQKKPIRSSDLFEGKYLASLYESPLIENEDRKLAPYFTGIADPDKIDLGSHGFVNNDLTPIKVTLDEAPIEEALYNSLVVKYQAAGKWFGYHAMIDFMMKSANPIVGFGNFWAYVWRERFDKAIAGIINAVAKVPNNIVGDGKKVLSRLLIIEAYKKKGAHFNIGKSTMVMNSKTLFSILSQQVKGTIPTTLITPRADMYISGKDSLETRSTNSSVGLQKTPYVFDGSLEIMFNDGLADGVVSLVKDGAIKMGTQEIYSKPVKNGSNIYNSGFMYEFKSRAGVIGYHAFGSAQKFIIYPEGYSFIGTHDPSSDATSIDKSYAGKYKEVNYITKTEYERGGMFELKTTDELNPFMNIQVSTTV